MSDEQQPRTARYRIQNSSRMSSTSSSSSSLSGNSDENMSLRFNPFITPACKYFFFLNPMLWLYLTDSFRLLSEDALKSFDSKLTDFEQSEIFDYPQVFFLGNTPKKIRGSVSTSKNNHGYDDERGDYHIILGDHIAFRYEIISLLGSGSFGQVVKVFDVKTGTFVALKIIRNKKRFHHQALVEVKILDHLRERVSMNS